MRNLLFAATALVTFGTLSSVASAAPALSGRVFQDGQLTGVSATSPTSGFLSFSGSTTDFSLVNVTATGFPLISQPSMTAQTTSISSANNFTGTHTLRIEITQTDILSSSLQTLGQLISTFTQNFLVNGQFISSATNSTYIDAGNGAFAQTTLLATSTATSGPTNSTSITSAPLALTGPLFSETAVILATFTGGGASLQSSSQIVAAVPEPMSLALFGVGLLGLGLVRKQRKSSSALPMGGLAA